MAKRQASKKDKSTSAPEEKLPAGSSNAERDTRIKALNSSIHKKYGGNVVGRASMLHKRIPRVRTNIMSLDASLGGGLPGGRVTILWGEESSGKTMVSKRSTAEAQGLCANCFEPPVYDDDGEPSCSCERGYRKMLCAWMDVEGAFDAEWAIYQGVDLDSLIYAQPEFAEQCVDIVEAWIRTGDIDWIVIDSLAALTPIEEIEKSAEQDIVGTHAKLLTKGTRKWGAALNMCASRFGRRPTIVAIQQIRKKIGVMYGNPDTMGGGEAQKFMASVIVKMWNGPTETDSSNVPLWTSKRFNIVKNRVSPPYKRGEYNMVVGPVESGKPVGSIMEEEFVFDQARARGLLPYEKEGGKIIVMDGQRLNGKGQVIRYWIDNPGSLEAYSNKLLETMANE